MRRCPRFQAPCLALLIALPAQAAPVAHTGRPDPLDAQAVVAPAVHVSALARYRPLGTLTVGAWKDANDTVTRIGGWRAYAREAARPDAPASAARGTP